MMLERATILIVDDVSENVVMLGDLLGDDHEIRFALNGPDALATAAEGGVDLILLDVMMPEIDGYEVCRRLKSDDRTAQIPVIFVTARDDVKAETQGLALGAVDYITKPFNAPVVIARVRTHLELKNKTDLLARMAQLDGLTGLANRRRFDEVIEREWRRAVRAQTWLSLLMLDIDHFKRYNDLYGHPAGDGCLRRVADCLAEGTNRAGDLVARYGGEEFAVLLSSTDLEGARLFAESTLQALRDLAIEHAGSSTTPLITVSIGAASTLPTTAGSPSQLIAAADALLYAAKEKGRDRVQCQSIDDDYRPEVSSSETTSPPSETTRMPRLPERIGPYRILSELGHGGMGIVYLAEQTEPVRRRVALKMLRRGFGQQQQTVRFEAERQAMARLQHPYIAQLYEAGATEDGHPYFAMELVDGVAITEYCDRNRLPIHERLMLFEKVCEGVQHAHEKGLLHRDLKPANILVTEESDRPVPKVLDFGIAKAIDQPLAEGTLLTAGVIGTPAYLSPEAVGATDSIFDLDTRSDVYSLGVLLYELLLGVRPFETSGMPVIQVLQRLSSRETPSSHARWKDLDEPTRERLAEQRGHDSKTLRRRLKGDLDWILQKALARDRRDRYGSPAALAEDLERHLLHVPVEARPPSALYRVAKFTRRRRGLVAAATLLLMLLVAGIVARTVEARRANLEAETAEQVTAFLVDLFEVSDPGQSKGETITARELLERGAEKLDKEFEGQPLVRARLLATIGDVQAKLGLYDTAGPLLAEALEIREAELGDDQLLLADNLSSLATLYKTQGRYAESEPLHERALAIREKNLGPDHQAVAGSLFDLATLSRRQGRYEEAEERYLRSLSIREDVFGPDDASVAQSLNGLAVLYATQGRHPEAELPFRRALEIREKALGPSHPDVATSRNNLALFYSEQGRFEEAEPLYRRALKIQEKVLGPEHSDVALSLNNLGLLYVELGRYEEVEPLYRRALEINTKVFGQEHGEIARTTSNLGNLYRILGRIDEAEPLYRRALEIRERTLGTEHHEVASSLAILASLQVEEGHLNEATRSAERALGIVEAAGRGGTLLSSDALAVLGESLWKQGRLDEAETLFEESLTIREEQLAPGSPRLATPLRGLAGVRRDQGRFEESEELYLRTIELLETSQGGRDPRYLKTLGEYAVLLRATDRPDEAARFETRAQGTPALIE